MDDDLAKRIGTTARAARKARGLTQEDAADAVGISLEFYARIERGKALPSVPTLIRLSTKLKVSADALLGLLGQSISTAMARREDIKRDGTMRKLVRRLQRASPSTIRLVSLLLREVQISRQKSRAR